MTLQELILTLHRFWADRGCVIHQPYDLEMGAGTFHPATFLRALGPEPWKAAYPQPCRRPISCRWSSLRLYCSVNSISARRAYSLFFENRIFNCKQSC